MRLALGTVQFGLDYGVSNQGGKCLPSEAAKIVEMAAQAGVEVIDTAPAYGDSETVLGEILPAGHTFKIVTKTPSFAASASAARAADLVERTLETSLSALRISRVHAVLVHHADELNTRSGEAVLARLGSLRDAGVIGKVGVSVYTPDQIDRLAAKYPVQVIQAPINILDQRLISGGQFRQLRENGVEIHGRSIFLQGLLLMPLDTLPPRFASLKPSLRRYHEARRQAGLSSIEASVGYVSQVPEVDYGVVGVTSAKEFSEILAAQANHHPALDWPSLAANGNVLLDPSRWTSAQ